MRRNFAQILKDAKVDIKLEYQKLYGLLFDRSIQVSDTKRISPYDELSDCFINFYFRGTCLTIDEFNEMHSIHFERDPKDFNIDCLVTLCEYFYNMLAGYQSMNRVPYRYMPVMLIDTQFYFFQIQQVIEAIGYMPVNQNGVTIIVEKSPEAIAVAESELIPEDLSYKVIAYNHYSMRGNIEGKKTALVQLAAILEGKRKALKTADSELDLFFMFNNLNIRHNNTNPEDKSKYKPHIAKMAKDEIEKWYDETYQMCLLAFLSIGYSDKKAEIKELKSMVDNENTD